MNIKNTFLQEIRFTALLYLGLSGISTPQSIDYPKLTQAIDYLARTAVYVTVPKYGQSGVGVLLQFTDNDTTEWGKIFLISAKHVFEKRDDAGKLLDITDYGVMTIQHWKKGKFTFPVRVLTRFEDIDMVFLSIPHIDSINNFYSKVISFARIAKTSQIKRGLSSFLSGYPLGLGTKGLNLNPVVQMGIISYVDIESQLILVDIPINPGNSGGPVYFLDEDTRLNLLGLAFAYEPSRDFVLRMNEPGYDIVLDSERAQKGDSVYVLAQRRKGLLLAPSNSSLARVVFIGDKLRELLIKYRNGEFDGK